MFRISFSGELAFEVNVDASYGAHVWEALMEAGREFDITPYGTETMHVLRAEKGFIIVGQDTDGSMTPLDLDMAWAVSLKKPFSFIGKRSLTRSDTARTDRKQLVGLLTEDPATVLKEGAQIIETDTIEAPMKMLGHVTSSYFSPELNRSIALAVVRDGIKRRSEEGVEGRARRALCFRRRQVSQSEGGFAGVRRPRGSAPECLSRSLQSPLHSFGLAAQARPADEACGVWANEVPHQGYISLRGNLADAAFQDGAASALGFEAAGRTLHAHAIGSREGALALTR